MTPHAPMPPGAPPGTGPYAPGQVQGHGYGQGPTPPSPPGDGGALAAAALVLAIVGCFGLPLVYVVLPLAVGGAIALEAIGIALALGAVVVIASIVLSVWALIIARRGQSGRKALAWIAVVLAFLSPFTAGAAALFGLLIASGGAHGRPLRRRDGRWAFAADAPSAAWSDPTAPAPDTSASSALERSALGAAWLEDARMEHASVAAFGRLALDLMALGGPPALVARAHHAALEEIEHAQLAYSIASAHLGAAVGAGPLPEAAQAWAPVDESEAARVERVVVESLVDGCVGEAAAARAAAEAMATTVDGAITAALGRIARDEASHAALAADIVAWALAGRQAEAARRGVERAVATLEASIAEAEVSSARAAGPALPGRLDPVRLAAIRADEARRVVGRHRAHRSAAA